jgi:hypothetical protein
MATEEADFRRRKPRQQAFRAGVAIVTAVITVAAVLLIGGGVLRIPGGLLGGELMQTRRLTSPDGRTDLVLTLWGGGGAAGWTEERVALEPHGPPTGDGDEQLAVFDPDAFVGARWLSNSAAEIRLLRLDGAMRERTLPATVRVGGNVVTLRVRWQPAGPIAQHLSVGRALGAAAVFGRPSG